MFAAFELKRENIPTADLIFWEERGRGKVCSHDVDESLGGPELPHGCGRQRRHERLVCQGGRHQQERLFAAIQAGKAWSKNVIFN